MDQEINQKKADNPAEASNKSLSSEKKTSKSLKAKSKIMKKFPTSTFLKSKKAIGAPQIQGSKRKNKKKIVPKVKNESSKTEDENVQKPNSREENQLKNVTDEKHNENSQENNNTQEKSGGLSKNQEIRNNKEKRGRSEKSQKNQKNKAKRDGLEKSQQNEKKEEKLGGLIFMCNAKTKPDCFHYRVMGVSTNKKDLVLSVKPGLKLFLYDFDLKLMYGIYKASSSGGMKLEPAAFGGSFPVQVRFDIHMDCYPLPESVFKKAINENFTTRHKFETELTVQQVRKLSELFRPAEVHPLHVHTPRKAYKDREFHEGVRESWPHSHGETFTLDSYANADAKSYPVLSHEKNQHNAYSGVVAIQKEEIPRESYSYMTEKEYRVYGLQGKGRNLTPTLHGAPTLDPYQRDHEREHFLRHSDPIYRDSIQAQREPVRADPLYLNEREYRMYGLGARPEPPSAAPSAMATTSTASALNSYSNDPYRTYHYSASYVDPYMPAQRRDEVSSGSYSLGARTGTYLTETDQLQRRETYQVERLYPTYLSDAQSDYNQRPQYQEARPEPVVAPLSSRYLFGGSSMSYH